MNQNFNDNDSSIHIYNTLYTGTCIDKGSKQCLSGSKYQKLELLGSFNVGIEYYLKMHLYISAHLDAPRSSKPIDKCQRRCQFFACGSGFLNGSN